DADRNRPLIDECGAARYRLPYRRITAVPFDDELYDREPQPEAVVVSSGLAQLNEGAEHALSIRFGNTRPVIFDDQSIRSWRDLESHRDPLPCVAQCVVEQIAQHRFHQMCIASPRLGDGIDVALDREVG